MALWQQPVFAFALLLVFLSGFILSTLLWHRRDSPCGRSFLCIVAGGTIWALGDMLNLLMPGSLWLTFSYIGIGSLPASWLAFCLEYTGRSAMLTRGTVLALCAIPAITIPIVATNELHHWMWQHLAGAAGTRVVYGRWYLVSAGYSYLLFVAGYLLLLLNLAETQGSHRRRVLMLLGAGLLPCAANLLQILDIYPRPAPNPTPVAFLLGSMVFFLALFRFEPLEIVPVARRAVIDQMNDALIVFGAQSQLVTLNPAAKAIFEVGRAENEAEAYARLRARWPQVAEALSSPDAVWQEVTWQRGEATEYFDVQGAVVRDARGNILGRFFVLRNITARKQEALERERLIQATQRTNELLRQEMEERKRMEVALQHSEQSWRAFSEHSPVGIYRVTPEGRYLMANPALLRMLGFDSIEDLASHPNAERDGFDAPAERARFKEVLERDGLVTAWECRWLRKDGTPLWVRENAQATRDERGQSVFYDGTVEDISGEKLAQEERARLEQQLQEIQRVESLGALAGGIAHDFNNLLMVILGNTELALEGLAPDAPARPLLRETRDASMRAAELCRQMLAFAGRGRFVISRLRLNDLVDNMTNLLRSTLSKKAELQLDLDANVAPVEGDVAQLRQLVLNLAANASEALGDKPGTVRLSVRSRTFSTLELREFFLGEKLRPGTYVCLEVSDTGCGMDPPTMHRMFDPFFSTKFPGRGLGLPAVLGIVRSHQGAIHVTSEVGRGTTVQAVFPTAGTAAAERAPAPAPPAASFEGQTVLLVDDEEPVRRVGRRQLESLGFSVVTAADGQEALELYQKLGGNVALVLLDQTMPRLSGEETLAELRRLNPQVRVVLMSGFSETEITLRFPRFKPEVFLQKPFEKDALLSVVLAGLKSEKGAEG